MPFKSLAQKKKFAELLARGEISQKTFDEWHKATGNKKLPERISPKKPVRSVDDLRKRFKP